MWVFVRRRRVTTLRYEKYDNMGKRAISLPDDLLVELDEGVRISGRSFSAEVRMRLENEMSLRGYVMEKRAPLAKDGVVGSEEILEKEISARLAPVDGDIRKAVDQVLETGSAVVDFGALRAKSEKTLLERAGVEVDKKDTVEEMSSKPLASRPFVSLMKDDVFGKKDAKRIAKEIPGLKVASDLAASTEAGGKEKSEKSRPKFAGAVLMKKGFFNEEYTSVAEAEEAAKTMGWKKGDYEIKPI